MAVKQVKGVIIPRHDTAENWAKARNFIPKKGELIIYDADSITYEVEGTPSSDKVRIKIGDGVTNVNLLPFVTTEHSGGSSPETGDMSNYYTKEEIEAYITNNVGAIVYLTTKESISENIELQDVYPIQDAESELRIVSKNRMTYSSEYASTTFSGINVDANPSNRIVLVSGKATSKVESKYATVSRVELPVNGKYTISVDNSGIDQTEKKCYVVYNLWNRSVLDSPSNFEDQGNIVRYMARLTAGNPVTIDTEEMNCGVIEFKVFVNSPSGGTFADANSQYFRIQVEYGEEATHYHAPMPETGIAGKKINIYGKNLLEELVTDIPSGSPIKLDGVEVGTFSGDDLGVFYWNGVMQRDFLITISTTGYTNDIKVPLLEGDEYTLVGNLERVSYGYGTIRDFRLVKGHTDYDESSPYEMESIECDANGVCNISHLKYPYSYIALDNFNGENNGYAIYLKYDPALSRDWTENQLNKINKRLNKVEADNIDPNNYYTKDEIDDVASQLMDSIANSPNIESKDNKVNSILDNCTDEQYPSAKAVYDFLVAGSQLLDVTTPKQWSDSQKIVARQNIGAASEYEATSLSSQVNLLTECLFNATTGVDMIAFKIGGAVCFGTPGIQWMDWCDSLYNIYGYTYDLEAVYDPEGDVIYEVDDHGGMGWDQSPQGTISNGALYASR